VEPHSSEREGPPGTTQQPPPSASSRRSSPATPQPGRFLRLGSVSTPPLRITQQCPPIEQCQNSRAPRGAQKHVPITEPPAFLYKSKFCFGGEKARVPTTEPPRLFGEGGCPSSTTLPPVGGTGWRSVPSHPSLCRGSQPALTPPLVVVRSHSPILSFTNIIQASPPSALQAAFTQHNQESSEPNRNPPPLLFFCFCAFLGFVLRRSPPPGPH